MLDENAVVRAIATWLEELGWTIESTCTTTMHGDDIVARMDEARLVVEVKGETSSRPGSARSGRPFDGKQVESRLAKAVLRCLESLSADDSTLTAMGLPDNDAYRNRVHSIEKTINRLGIVVMWVAQDGHVSLQGELPSR